MTTKFREQLEAQGIPNGDMILIGRRADGWQVVAAESIFLINGRQKNTFEQRWCPGCERFSYRAHDVEAWLAERKLAGYRPEVLGDSSYDCHEPVEPDDY